MPSILEYSYMNNILLRKYVHFEIFLQKLFAEFIADLLYLKNKYLRVYHVWYRRILIDCN